MEIMVAIIYEQLKDSNPANYENHSRSCIAYGKKNANCMDSQVDCKDNQIFQFLIFQPMSELVLIPGVTSENAINHDVFDDVNIDVDWVRQIGEIVSDFA